MKFAHILTALTATISILAMGTGTAAYANDGERTSSQRATVAQASARIVSATTFSFSSAADDGENKESSKNAGRSEIVRECADSAQDGTDEIKSGNCADMRIVDLH